MVYEYSGKLKRVVDGDTIDVTLDLGFKIFHTIRLRLKGIDTPETYGVSKDSDEYALGKLATNFVIEKLTGKDLVIVTDKDKTGKYGRYVATVMIDDDDFENLNLLLLSEGLATSVKY